MQYIYDVLVFKGLSLSKVYNELKDLNPKGFKDFLKLFIFAKSHEVTAVTLDFKSDLGRLKSTFLGL